MSRKQQVMEALLTSNVDLNKDDLMWINSHLPGNDEGMGIYKKTYKFTHDHDDLFKCIGVTEDDARKVAEVFAVATKNLLMKENYAVSNGIEEILNNTSDIEGFEALIVGKLLKDSMERINEEMLPSALSQIIKQMRKKNNED